MLLSYENIINQRNTLHLPEALCRAFGLDYAVLIMKVFTWQDFNEVAEKKGFFRDGKYWFPVKGTDLRGDGIGNINYIPRAEVKIKELVEQGVLEEHLESKKGKKGRAERWVRVNLPAFEQFMSLWVETGQPLQNRKVKGKDKDGKPKVSPYGAFSSAWDDIKNKFVSQTKPKPKPKKTAKELAAEMKQKAENKAIAALIDAWLKNQKAKSGFQGNPYQIPTFRSTMLVLHEKGATPQNIADYVSAKASPSKYVGLKQVQNDLFAWLESQKQTGTMDLGLVVESNIPVQPKTDEHKQALEQIDKGFQELLEAF